MLRRLARAIHGGARHERSRMARAIGSALRHYVTRDQSRRDAYFARLLEGGYEAFAGAPSARAISTTSSSLSDSRRIADSYSSIVSSLLLEAARSSRSRLTSSVTRCASSELGSTPACARRRCCRRSVSSTRAAPVCLPKTQLVRRADEFSGHGFVHAAVDQHRLRVDAGFVCEHLGPDDRLMLLERNPAHPLHEAREVAQLFVLESRQLDAVQHAQRHHELVKLDVAGALAVTVGGNRNHLEAARRGRR